MALTGARIRIDVDAPRAAIVRCRLLCHLASPAGAAHPWGGARFSIEGLDKTFGDAEVCAAVVAGEELRYAYVNESYRRIHPGATMVGRTYRDVFPEAASGGAEERLREVIASGRSWVVEDYPTPLPHRDIPAWWQGECVPVALGANEADAVFILIWDVSHRHLPSAGPAARSKSRSRVEIAKDTLRARMAALGLTPADGWTISEEVRETARGTSWVMRPLHMHRDAPPLEVIVDFASEGGDFE